MTAWMDEANCRHPLWHHLTLEGQREQCGTCPVAAECLAQAEQIIRDTPPANRKDLLDPRRPDVWAGRTMRELMQP